MEERKPAAVFLVTTCVPEIIGDDFDAAADILTEDKKIKKVVDKIKRTVYTNIR